MTASDDGEILGVELLRGRFRVVLCPSGHQGRTVSTVLSVLRHRMASISLLYLILGFALVLSACGDAGAAGGSGQTDQTGLTGTTAQAGLVI